MKSFYLKFYLSLTFVFIAFFGTSQTIESINVNDTIKVETNDDNVYLGVLTFKDIKTLRIKTDNVGEITIKKENIKSIIIAKKENLVNGEIWPNNPNPTLYLFSQSAFGLKKGEGYYHNTWILLNQISYGFSDNLSCGFGIMPLFIFSRETSTPLWITPKYTFGKQNTKVNFSIGGIGIFVPSVNVYSNNTSLGILYGTGTFGDINNNVSVGIGLALSGDALKYPAFNFSAMQRIGKRSYFITENWFSTFRTSEANLISVAYRYATRNASIDFGLFRPLIDIGRIIGIPWLGVTIPIGKKVR
jgi:hypothetical protein